MSKNSSGITALERYLRPSAIGAGIGALLIAALLCILGVILTVGDLPSGTITPLALAALVLGAFGAGIVAAKLSGEKGMLCGIVAGSILFLLVWASGGIIGVGDVGMLVAIRFAMVAVASTVGGVVGVNSHKRGKI